MFKALSIFFHLMFYHLFPYMILCLIFNSSFFSNVITDKINLSKFIYLNVNKCIIIGAGPAGLTFAWHAARKGLNVTVYEGRKVFATKPCGEALAGDSLSVLPFKIGYMYKWILSPMRFVELYYNGRYYRTIKSPFGENGYIINKRLFLQELADIVEKEGAKIEMGKFFKPSLDDADLIVDASGYLTASRNYLNLRELYNKEYRNIPVLRDYAESNGILKEGYLLIDLLDRGYFWIFPYGKDTYNIGIGGLYSGEELRKIYEKKINQFELKLIKNTRQGASVSIGGIISNQRIGKYYIIGEAAGFVMPTTGEGIRFSILSAYEYFNNNSLLKNIRKRIQFNAKLLRLAIELDDKLKSKLISQAPEDLIMVFLGERSVSTNDIIKFLSVFSRNLSTSLQRSLYSIVQFLISNKVDTKKYVLNSNVKH
jgi:hypothetical protein